MVTAHCRGDIVGQDDPYQINKDDFERAREMFEEQDAPSLKVFLSHQFDILTLIAQGESETVEFKSSMRYDYKRQIVNKEELGLVVARTVAGFLNRSGGILLIGVNDAGEILGIEKDFETLTKGSIDGFQIAFRDIIRSHLGVENVANLSLYFETMDGHVVCMVVVEKSGVPVYVKNGNESEFHVRMLNSTNKLNLPETVNYIRSRWG
jgi:predicted HTH transcriptional regulator